MLVESIIQRVQTNYSKGVRSDDSRLSDRFIYSKLLTTRAILISQKSNKRQKLNDSAIQILPCVELVEALPYECPCLPPVGCTILKTKYPLPKFLSDKEKNLIFSVTSLLGDISFSEESWEGYKYLSSGKYTSNIPVYFLKNNYLYISQKKDLPRVITIRGIFYDPSEVEKFPSFCFEKEEVNHCYNPYKDVFHLDPSLEDALIEMTTASIFQYFLGRRNDIQNNNIDEVQNEEQQRIQEE